MPECMCGHQRVPLTHHVAPLSTHVCAEGLQAESGTDGGVDDSQPYEAMEMRPAGDVVGTLCLDSPGGDVGEDGQDEPEGPGPPPLVWPSSHSDRAAESKTMATDSDETDAATSRCRARNSVWCFVCVLHTLAVSFKWCVSLAFSHTCHDCASANATYQNVRTIEPGTRSRQVCGGCSEN